MPWFDWLDYVGADAMGRLIGLWLRFCVSLPRKLVAFVVGSKETRPKTSWLRRLGKMAISTLFTLGVWSVVTWRPVWAAAGAEGDRVLTVVLIFVSAAWPISLVWIWLSKPKDSNRGCQPPSTRIALLRIKQGKSNMSCS